MKLDALKLGYAGAIWAALLMVVLSIFAAFGIYTGAAEQMQSVHMYYSTSVGGTIAGALEAAIISFVLLYVFGVIYNKLVK